MKTNETYTYTYTIRDDEVKVTFSAARRPSVSQLAWAYYAPGVVDGDAVYAVDVYDSDERRIATVGVTQHGPVWLPRGARVRGDGSVEWRGRTLQWGDCCAIKPPCNMPEYEVVAWR